MPHEAYRSRFYELGLRSFAISMILPSLTLELSYFDHQLLPWPDAQRGSVNLDYRVRSLSRRRTVATRIAERLGVGGEQLIKRVLGHADGSVTAIYNHYGYVKEMRAVLEEWAADLTVECERVTDLKRAPPEQRRLRATEKAA